MNTIAISGNLTATPELKTTSEGVPVCSFTVAVRRPKTKDTTDFITVVAWRQQAEFVSSYFTKGQRIEIAGYLTRRAYKDRNGNNRASFEVICTDVSFGESKKTAEQREDEAAAEPDDYGDFEPVEGDLPF